MAHFRHRLWSFFFFKGALAFLCLSIVLIYLMFCMVGHVAQEGTKETSSSSSAASPTGAASPSVGAQLVAVV